MVDARDLKSLARMGVRVQIPPPAPPAVGASLRSEIEPELAPHRIGPVTGFEHEQQLLGRDSAAEAGERAVGADDPVAWDDDWNRVRAVGRSDGAFRTEMADSGGNLTVGSRLTVGDFAELGPDLPLKRAALRIDRKVELEAFPAEVLIELSSNVIRSEWAFENLVALFDRAGNESRPDVFVQKLYRDHGACLVDRTLQRPARALDTGCVVRHLWTKCSSTASRPTPAPQWPPSALPRRCGRRRAESLRRDRL